MKHLFKLVYVCAIVGVLCWGFSGCTSAGGVRSSALVFAFNVTDADQNVVALGRSDLNTTVLFGQGAVSAEIFQKPTSTMPGGFPIWGPIETTFGKVFVYDKARDIKQVYEAGARLPAFTKVLFRAGEAELFGILFEEN